jgi:hemolysin III
MMFLMSCLYHSFKWGTRVKRLWRRFDYISIYLLIGGTFTPMWLLFWQG